MFSFFIISLPFFGWWKDSFLPKTPTSWCGIPPELGPPNDQGVHPSRVRPYGKGGTKKLAQRARPCELRKKKRPDTDTFP